MAFTEIEKDIIKRWNAIVDIRYSLLKCDLDKIWTNPPMLLKKIIEDNDQALLVQLESYVAEHDAELAAEEDRKVAKNAAKARVKALVDNDYNIKLKDIVKDIALILE